MKPDRATPAGLETANTRGGGLRYHEPMDNAVENLDAEVIPYGASHFQEGLMEDMRMHSQRYLEIHYPELVFGWHEGRKSPVDRDFKVQLTGGWRWAQWRTAAIP